MTTQWRLSHSYKAIDETSYMDPRRWVGRFVLTATTHAGRVSFMVAEMARGLLEWRIWVPRAFDQGVQVGYGSLFIVLLTAAFAGGVVALQTGYQFTGSIPVYFAAGVIVETMILEMGPVLTALILAGRIGARYAAELGTMRVTEQIDALESLGRSSVSHLLLPRVVAGTIMTPVLVIFAIVVGIVSGYFGARAALDITHADFAYGARYFFKSFDVWYSMTKSLAFGLALTVIPCYVGFSTQKGAEGVGRSTTAAVVASSVLILFLDAVLAQVLLN